MRRVILAVLLLGATSSAWAAGWWYLVVPPRSDYDERAPFLSGYKILESKPLSEWRLGGIFDSILHCVARRDALALTEHRLYTEELGVYLKAEREPTEPELLRYDRYTAEVHHANTSAYSASRCVSSKDFKFGPPR